MQHEVNVIIEESFSRLITELGFRKENTVDTNCDSAKFISEHFGIKVEKYRREFYVTLFKLESPNQEINMFNLLNYLNLNSNLVLESNYFADEANVMNSYRKQLEYISSTLYRNFQTIKEFFGREDFSSEHDRVNEFMRAKYPNLFQQK